MIHPLFMTRIEEISAVLAMTMPTILKEVDKTGCYVCIGDPTTGLPMLLVPFGEIPDEKAEKYCQFAQEKSRRLAQNREYRSSFHTRNPDEQKFAGAIRGYGLILSCSGLPEMMDEAAMLTLAVGMHELTIDEADGIVKTTGNILFWSDCKEKFFANEK